jgi:DNA-binding transcriptional MerR regulator
MRVLMTIGELADAVGVATSTLRYYEDLGLLTPAERRAGRRYYEPSAVEAVGAILLLADVGFTLGEVAELQACRADPPARRALLSAKIDELARRAEEITVACEALRHGLDCPAPDLTTCPNFTAVVRDSLAARAAGQGSSVVDYLADDRPPVTPGPRAAGGGSGPA